MNPILKTLCGTLFAVMLVPCLQAQAQTESFFREKKFPPSSGSFIAPTPSGAAFANGIAFRNLRCRAPGQNVSPPPLGGHVSQSFGSQVEMDFSPDGGASWLLAVVPATVTDSMNHTLDAGGQEVYATEMTSLMMTGGLLPAGVLIRESPTLSSAGSATIRAVPGGFMVSSFFDIYTEVSTDGGATWSPATNGPTRLELRGDPELVTPLAAPSRLLPPPVDQYASPPEYPIALANGVRIKNVRHKIFTPAIVPPVVGAPPVQPHLDSQLDFLVSLNGGATWTPMRSPGGMDVQITRIGTGPEEFYDTEMLALNIAGGDLPPGMMIRESPTEASRGMTAINVGGGGGGGGGAAVQSFFDIFLEVSLDGGQTWGPPTNGPVRLEAKSIGAEGRFANSLLLPTEGEYDSAAGDRAVFAGGLILSNVVQHFWTQSVPPPAPGGRLSHSFGSQVEMDVSTDGGGSFLRIAAPATQTVKVTSSQDNGNTRYFDTEMLQLNASGGGLPAGMMIRESPTRASLGRTSIRADGVDHDCDSFFDIYFEVSLDGGGSWQPASSGPLSVILRPPAFNLICPSDITLTTANPAGVVVQYPAPTLIGGCPPVTVVCKPPSGSAFPVGVTTVRCSAFDGCGGQAACSFNVTVQRQRPPAYFFKDRTFPPTNGVYVTAAEASASFANGIVIRDVRHRNFSAGSALPPLGSDTTSSFNSRVDFDLSTDNGTNWTTVYGLAPTSLGITRSADVSGEEEYSATMQTFTLTGGSLPSGVLIRESPTLSSGGETGVRAVSGGYLASSFFDIFLEISTDGGGTWTPTQNGPLTVHLLPDPIWVYTDMTLSRLMPPPTSEYVAPTNSPIALANGILIRDVHHKLFAQSVAPPAVSNSLTHSFASQLDFQLSQDGGSHWQPIRAPTTTTVTLNRFTHGTEELYEAEMIQWDVSGGFLPLGVFFRESPTLPSRGTTRIEADVLVSDGGGGVVRTVVNSFFDIFLEVSTDNGQTWTSPTNGPAHVEVQPVGQIAPLPSNLLPPQTGACYRGRFQCALFASGIVISNLAHRSFSDTFAPPPPGMTDTHSFGGWVDLMVSTDGGMTFSSVAAPANATMQIGYSASSGDASAYDTEMQALNISGGTLPAGLMIRESPTRASLGRVVMRSSVSPPVDTESFFDLYLEVSTDGGVSWQPALTKPWTVVLQQAQPPLPMSIVCPTNLWALATSPGGAVVNYPAPGVSYGCPVVNISNSPPSGSLFPVGTTVVTCTARDTCGQQASCSFNVTVRSNRQAPEIFFRTNTLPPLLGAYVCPAQWFVLYANGVAIRDLRQRNFSRTFTPPAPGATETRSFDSVVDFQYSTDGGLTWSPATAPANATVQTTGAPGGGTRSFDTEMLALNIVSGALLIRESPARPSLGRTTIRTVNGGYMVGSFFDVFTEVSLDGGMTWSPGQDGGPLELRFNSDLVAPIPAPTALVPPPNDLFSCPAQWFAVYPPGVAVRDFRHSLFAQFTSPPPVGVSSTVTFNSTVDLQLSTDGGTSWHPARANALAQMSIARLGSGSGEAFDTEMLAFNLTGGDLPAGLMIRESPTEPSRGGVVVTPQPDGTYRVCSFFDLFTEVSVDGGMTWSPGTSGPARTELTARAPLEDFPAPDLEPLTGRYYCPNPWFAYFASGVVISNFIHHEFTQAWPPPPPGPVAPQIRNCGSMVSLSLSTDGGSTFNRVSAPATVSERIQNLTDSGVTRYFDTEMLQLNIAGGGLPPGFMIRESPTKASLGRTSERTSGGGASYTMDSFFDIFVELSTDGGNTWSPSLSGPAPIFLVNRVPALTCPRLTVNWSSPNQVVLSWRDNGQACLLQYALALDAPINWQTLTLPVVGLPDGSKSVTLTGLKATSFFRLCGGCP